MLRRNFLKGLGLFTASTAIPGASLLAHESRQSSASVVSGSVKDVNGKPVSEVVVSDGYTTVLTDKKGSYQLAVNPKSRFIFISVPSGYEIPSEKGIAFFYLPLEKENKNYDFTLKRLSQKDDKHAFIVWADPQIQTAKEGETFRTVSAPDTLATIKTLGNIPVHGIGCGDIVFDHPELYDDYRTAVQTTGIPFYTLIGNHDQTYTARTDDASQEIFMQNFGPTYYSFNRGKIHYICLDDVFFVGQGHRYIGYLTEDILSWLEKDLSYVPKGSTIVVSLHIPSNTGDAKRNKEKEDPIGGVLMNRNALYKIVENYKVHFISGHTHWNEVWEKDNMIEHDLGTLCGAWWTGPICGDGTPSGYMVFEVDGNELKWYYKSTGYDKSHQLVIYKEGAIPSETDKILVNAWNADSHWKIEWWEGETYKGLMTQYTGYDPEAYKLYLGPQLPKKHKWVEPVLTDHLFTAAPADKSKNIKVKATDRFGNVFTTELKR